MHFRYCPQGPDATTKDTKEPENPALRVASRRLWSMNCFSRAGAIVGARNAKQAEGVMRAGELRLTHAEMSEIEASLATAAV